MKKLLVFIAMLLSITSCGPSSTESPTNPQPTEPTSGPVISEPTTNTEEPTVSPTETPTEVPTETPTVVPTETPTEKPTEKPTEAPTQEHIHTFDTSKYSFNEEFHWYPSTCGHPETEEKIPHEFNKKVVDPTYDSTGYTEYSCKDCDYSYKGDEKTKLEHKYSNKYSYDEKSHWFACIDKGYEHLKKDEQSHKFTTVVTDPTFEKDGYTTHTCSVCEYSYTSNPTNKLEHKYSTTYSYDEKSHWFACIDKGYEHLRKDEKPHDFNTKVVEPTYTAQGYTHYSCKKCEYNFKDNFVNQIKYKITYHLDGGVNHKDNPDSYTFGDSFELLAPTKDGCAFKYWENKSGEIVTSIKSTDSGDIVLYAKWDTVVTIVNGTLTDFDDTKGLYDVSIPEGVTRIASGVFENTNIYSVTIPSTIKVIETDAFADCLQLSVVKFAGTLEQWCNVQIDYATASPMFYGQYFLLKNSNGEWEELTDVVIPSSIKTVNNYIFFDFDNIRTVYIHKNVTAINYYGFRSCVSLEKVTFEEGSNLSTIGELAFNKCYSLTSITIPNKVTTIQASAFEECELLKTAVLPNSITNLGINVFHDCDSLENINIPTGLKTIPLGTFNSCAGLKTITIPNNITSIEDSAFSSCISLIKMAIPSSVTSIGAYAFDYCKNMGSVKIPSSVKTIGRYAFDDCEKLIIYAQATSQPSGWHYDWNSYYCNVYWGKASNDIVEIDSIEYIVSSGKAMISGCIDTIEDVVIPTTVNIKGTNYTVTSIGLSAFESRVNIKSIILANTITVIGDRAFAYSDLLSIVIPKSVTTIYEESFYFIWDICYFCEASSKPSGWHEEWYSYSSNIYWAGQWKYDSNGKPTPIK